MLQRMSDKGLARNLFPGGSPSRGRSSPSPDPTGFQRFAFTGGYVPRGTPSPTTSNPHMPGGRTGGRTGMGGRSADLSAIPRNPSRTSLTPLTRTIGKGFAGSSSMGAINPLTGAADPLADMAGTLRHASTYRGHGDNDDEFLDSEDDELDREFGSREQTPHHSGTQGGSNVVDSHGSERPMINRDGDKFGVSGVHRAAMRIFWRSFNGPWDAFTKIPPNEISQMFERFRTLYRWDPNQEARIREGFRKRSARMARADGHVITNIEDSFEILQNYSPRAIHGSFWRTMCMYWNTEAWNKKSKAAKENRNTTDRRGTIARHTGGSISVAEHRKKLTELTGVKPPFMDVFMKTHLNSEAKKRYFEGDRELRSEDFISGKAEDAVDDYNKALFEKYGDDQAQHIVDDPELWSQTQLRRDGGKKKGRIFGIGASDLHFVVTGTFSTGTTSASGSNSGADFEKSQQEVNELREQLATMQQTMEQRGNNFDLQMQQLRNEMALQMKQQFETFMSQFRPPGNT